MLEVTKVMLQCLLVALVVDFPVQETVVCEQSWYWRCPFQIPIPDGGWCRPWRVLVLGLFLVALQKWLGWCPNAPLWQWLLWCALPETSQSSTVLDLELHSVVAWWCGAYVRLRQRPCWSRVGYNRSVSRCLGISDSPVRWWWWEVMFRKIFSSESQIGGQWGSCGGPGATSGCGKGCAPSFSNRRTLVRRHLDGSETQISGPGSRWNITWL